VTYPDFGQVGHALRDASQDKSQTIKNIHLDLMQRKMLEAEHARCTFSADPSLVHAAATLTSLCEKPDIDARSKTESNNRDSEYYVAESNHEVDNESISKSEMYILSSAANSSPSQIMRTTIEITEGVFTEDCSPYGEFKNIAEGKVVFKLIIMFLSGRISRRD
jgi:hypothetical protein